jgi:hypothetical protein
LPLPEGVDEVVAVVCGVANQSFWMGVLEQRLGGREIVGLSWCERQFDRIAESIDERVYLGGQPPARSTDRLRAVFFLAPALCWCARTMVLSMIMYSLSGSLANCLKMRSKTPLFAQRLKR